MRAYTCFCMCLIIATIYNVGETIAPKKDCENLLACG